MTRQRRTTRTPFPSGNEELTIVPGYNRRSVIVECAVGLFVLCFGGVFLAWMAVIVSAHPETANFEFPRDVYPLYAVWGAFAVYYIPLLARALRLTLQSKVVLTRTTLRVTRGRRDVLCAGQ